MNTLAQFKNTYLNKAYSRLNDNIVKMFSGTLIPSSEDIQTIVNIITSELELSKLSSDEFAIDVSKTMAKGLKSFASKSEALIATDSSAYQLLPEGPGTTTSQYKNIKIYSNLYQLYLAIVTITNNISQAQQIGEAFNESLKSIQTVAETILTNLFSKVSKQLEQTLNLIHNENYGK